MVKFQTSRGGASVDLSPAEVKTLNELRRSDRFARGDAGTFVGKGRNVFKAGGFLLAQRGRKQFLSLESSLRGQAIRKGIAFSQQQLRQEALKRFKQQQVDLKLQRKVGVIRGQAKVISRRPTIPIRRLPSRVSAPIGIRDRRPIGITPPEIKKPQIKPSIPIKLTSEEIQSATSQQDIQDIIREKERQRRLDKDPLFSFVTKDIPTFSKQLFKDFVSNPKDREDIKAFINNIQSKGDKAIASLEKTKEKIENFLDPSQASQIKANNIQFNKIGNQQSGLNNEVDLWNKKFGNRELTNEEFNQAQKQADSLAKKQLILNAKTNALEDRTKRIKSEREFSATAPFFSSFLKSVATAPISLAQFGISGTTRPVQTTKNVVSSLIALPVALSDKPFSTLGELIGGFIGTSATISFLKKFTSFKNLDTSKKSFVIEKVPRIKKTPLSKTFVKEVKFKINEGAVNDFVKIQLNKRGFDFNKLSKIEQNFLTGQIKAKIKTQPERFLPKATQQALKNVKAKNISQLIKDRLEGKFDKPIFFEKIGKKKFKDLTATQQLALRRFLKTKKIKEKKAEKRRVSKATKFVLQRKKIKLAELLSKKAKKRIVSRIRARVKADPTITLSKTQKIALRKAKTQSELARIEKAISKRLEGKEIELSSKQKATIKRKIKRIIKSEPEKFIPEARKQALKNLQKVQEKRVISRAKKLGKREIKPFELLSKTDKKFIKGQFKAKIKAQPERFIPKARRQALIQIQKPEIKQVVPEFKIVSGRLTSVQKLALKRLNKVRKQQQKIIKKTNVLQQKQKTINKKLQQKQSQFQKQRLTKQLNKNKQKLKSETKIISGLRFRSTSFIKQLQPSRTRQISRLAQPSKFKQPSKTALKLAQPQRARLKQATRLRTPTRTRLIRKTIKKTPGIPLVTLKGKKIKKKKKKEQGFFAFARPLKKRKGQKKPKLIRVNKSPLTQPRAEDLRNFVIDTSLARTGKISPTRLRARSPRINIPLGFASRTRPKFRTFRIVKGKKRPLRKGKVIERKGKPLLDTIGEKRGISLRRRISQLRKKVKTKPTKKRKMSNLQLKVLAKGRAKRLKNLRKK